jgi:hypothetical protein
VSARASYRFVDEGPSSEHDCLRATGWAQAPLVVTLSLDRRDPSPPSKEIGKPTSGRFTHHLDLYRLEDINSEIEMWLQDAWKAAGQTVRG